MFVSVCFLFVRPERPAPTLEMEELFLPPTAYIQPATRWPQLSDISIFPGPGFELQLPKYERNLKPEIFSYFSGQERGGVGIQLPSIPLWPWSSSQERKARPVSSLNIGQRRQETGDPRYHSVNDKVVVVDSHSGSYNDSRTWTLSSGTYYHNYNGIVVSSIENCVQRSKKSVL